MLQLNFPLLLALQHQPIFPLDSLGVAALEEAIALGLMVAQAVQVSGAAVVVAVRSLTTDSPAGRAGQAAMVT